MLKTAFVIICSFVMRKLDQRGCWKFTVFNDDLIFYIYLIPNHQPSPVKVVKLEFAKCFLLNLVGNFM